MTQEVHGPSVASPYQADLFGIGDEFGATQDPLESMAHMLMQDISKAQASGAPVRPEVLDNLFKLQMLKKMSDGSESGGAGVSGIAKTIRSYHQLKDRINRQPLHIIREFVENMERQLGVAANQPYTIKDFSMKISWGRFRSMHRVFLMMGIVFEMMDRGKVLEAQAMLCQSMKSVHQMVLDDGSWKVAWMLTGLQDPYIRDRFGGSKTELEVIANYTRVIDELEKKTVNTAGAGTAQEEEPSVPTVSAKEKARRYNQASEARAKAKAKAGPGG
jgi:hypothetical protein